MAKCATRDEDLYVTRTDTTNARTGRSCHKAQRVGVENADKLSLTLARRPPKNDEETRKAKRWKEGEENTPIPVSSTSTSGEPACFSGSDAA